MRLSNDQIDWLFARLTGIYGTQFTAKFSHVDHGSGKDVGIANAKDVWADDLGGFGDNKAAILHALENLPSDFPPSSRGFRDLCRLAPRHQPLALAHKLTPEEQERAAEFAEQVKKQAEKPKAFDPLFWATHPGTKIAFGMVRSEALKRRQPFVGILDDLIRQGVTDGELMLKRWEGGQQGGQWVSA